jgi:hypothetical protein
MVQLMPRVKPAQIQPGSKTSAPASRDSGRGPRRNLGELHMRRYQHGADLPIGTLLASLASRSDLSDLLGRRTRQIICQTNH